MKQLITALVLAGFTGASWAQLPNLPIDPASGAGIAGQLQSALTGLAGSGASLGPETLVIGFNNIDDAANALVSGAGYRQAGLRGAGLAALDPDSPNVGNVTQAFNNGNAALQGFAVQLAAGTPAEALAATYVAGSNTLYSLLLPVYQQIDGPAEMLVSAGAPLTGPLHNAIAATTFRLNLNFDQSGLPSLGTGGLPLGELPLSPDALDAGTLTMLTSGASLPSLP